MSSCPPMISQHYQTYMLEMGYDAHLKCVTIGRHLTIWLGPDEQPITDNDKFKIMPDGSLIIHDLDFSDMGAYVCVAKNKYGHAMAETFVYPVAVSTYKHFKFLNYMFTLFLYFVAYVLNDQMTMMSCEKLLSEHSNY